MDNKPNIDRLTNQAEVTRTEAHDHPSRGQARANVRMAANSLTPFGMEHQGSFVVHLYKSPVREDFSFVFQMIGLDQIPEAEVDVALKELRRNLMELYGRTEKTRSKI